ncbi:MAG: DUF2591 domain-containing protein [Candidatus Scalindua sp.]|nr:DUF2591 domain-containing protein [Candidatus Scalindua sp.]
MNYNELTDFEINKLVAEKLDKAGLLPYIVTFNDSNEVVYLCEKDSLSSIYPIAHFDPCNNPSDAWPIILDSEITLYAPRHLTHKDSWGAQYYVVNSPKIIRDKNPLRAAMIVYLMLSEE